MVNLVAVMGVSGALEDLIYATKRFELLSIYTMRIL